MEAEAAVEVAAMTEVAVIVVEAVVVVVVAEPTAQTSARVLPTLTLTHTMLEHQTTPSNFHRSLQYPSRCNKCSKCLRCNRCGIRPSLR